MAFKIVLLVCAIANVAFSQTLGRPNIAGPFGLGIDGLGLGGIGPIGAYGPGCGCGAPASSGGGFPVTSFSPIAPTGLTVVSENAIEGVLNVGGEVPFLGAVALEGVLPTAGAGSISYGCGSGAVGIASEGPIATGIVGQAPYGSGYPAGLGGPSGLVGPAGLVGPSGLGSPLGYGGLGYNGLGLGCAI